MRIRIGGVVDVSTVDWSGNVTFMIFTAGCCFRCHFCQNASLVPIDSGEEVDIEAIKRRIKENMLLLDAVGFSGGEPALQPMPVTEIFRWAKKMGLKTFLNTNGINPDLLDKLIQEKLVDYVAISIIAPLKAEDYERIANIKEGRKAIEKVKRSIDLCLRSKVPLEIRTTIVPTLIDDEESIREIARSVKNCYTYVLQAFDPSGDVLDKRFKEVPSPKRELLVKLAKAAFEEGLREVRIRTRDRGEEIIARRNV